MRSVSARTDSNDVWNEKSWTCWCDVTKVSRHLSWWISPTELNFLTSEKISLVSSRLVCMSLLLSNFDDQFSFSTHSMLLIYDTNFESAAINYQACDSADKVNRELSKVTLKMLDNSRNAVNWLPQSLIRNEKQNKTRDLMNYEIVDVWRFRIALLCFVFCFRGVISEGAYEGGKNLSVSKCVMQVFNFTFSWRRCAIE